VRKTPQSYLDEALERQGLDSTPNRLKAKWSDGEYKYEVRLHEGESQYTDANRIYRVQRQSVPNPDPKIQGTGKEYMDINGKWHHESELTEVFRNESKNPKFNFEAVRDTHIPLDPSN